MTASLPFNPVLTSVASGSFNVQSDGYIQGVQLDDPAARFALAGGILADSETIPMWGGVGIYEDVAGSAAGYVGSPGGPISQLGGLVGRATALTGSKALTGFSVFNQDHSMINTPQSPVPLAGSKMGVNFLRFGSGARLAVACDPALAAYAGAQLITVALAWDYVNQLLIPYSGAINIGTGNTYNGSTGVVTLNLASSPGVSPGDSITVASVTGTGSFAAVNGVHTAGAGTTGTVLKFTIATGLTLTIDDSAGTVATAAQLTGAQAVRLLDVNAGNSMTVTWDGTYATWNRSGNTATILI